MSHTYQIHVHVGDNWQHMVSVVADDEEHARRQGVGYVPPEHAGKPVKVVLQVPPAPPVPPR